MLKFFKVTSASFSSVSKFLELQLRGAGDEGNDDSAVPADGVQFPGVFGLAVKPIVQSSLRALGQYLGDEIVPAWLWDRTKMPTDVGDGETRVYSVGDNTVRIKLMANGELHIDGPAKIVLNGGTQNVAREHDTLDVGTLTGQAGPYPVVFNYTPGGYPAPGIPTMGPMAKLTGIIADGTGNKKIKG